MTDGRIGVCLISSHSTEYVRWSYIVIDYDFFESKNGPRTVITASQAY
jgi:hypothetical protein